MSHSNKSNQKLLLGRNALCLCKFKIQSIDVTVPRINVTIIDCYLHSHHRSQSVHHLLTPRNCLVTSPRPSLTANFPLGVVISEFHARRAPQRVVPFTSPPTSTYVLSPVPPVTKNPYPFLIPFPISFSLLPIVLSSQFYKHPVSGPHLSTPQPSNISSLSVLLITPSFPRVPSSFRNL